MKKLFRGWTAFEIIFLFVSLATIIVCFFLGNDKNYLSLISSIVGVVSVLTVAKGLVFAPFISILYNVLYSIISITQSYYGEAIIYIFLMMPVSVISIITWLKNKSKQNDSVVEVNKIKTKEYFYLFAVTLVLTGCFYFLLKALNTSELIISTLSLISSVVASYLMLRRSSYYAIGFIINDIILILLWGIVTINSGFAYLPTTICFVVFLVNDIYGFIHWKIEEKKQFEKSNDKNFLHNVIMENKLIYEEVELVLLDNKHKTLLLSWLTDKRVLAFWEGEDEVFDAVRIEENFYSSEDFDMTRFVIKYKNECVGYLQAYLLNEEMKNEYEYLGKEVCAATDCFIGKPELWGKGVGYKAMKLAKDFLFKKGAQSILVDPHIDNIRAIRCYEKIGFEKIKILYKHELHNKKYIDCYLMKCDLKV